MKFPQFLENWKNKYKYRKVFPKYVKKEWFAYHAYEKDRRKWKHLAPYWDKKGEYIDYNVGDIIPFYRHKKVTAHYKITNIETRYCDNAMWDDTRNYDLEFHHIIIK